MSSAEFVRQFKTVIKRLEASKSPRKRKNARREASAFFRSVIKAYPLITETGEPKPARKGVSCPMCKIPFKTWTAFADHARVKHFGYKEAVEYDKIHNSKSKLACRGCKFENKNYYFVWTGFIAHLRALHKKGQLLDHLVAGETSLMLEKTERERLINGGS